MILIDFIIFKLFKKTKKMDNQKDISKIYWTYCLLIIFFLIISYLTFHILNPLITLLKIINEIIITIISNKKRNLNKVTFQNLFKFIREISNCLIYYINTRKEKILFFISDIIITFIALYLIFFIFPILQLLFKYSMLIIIICEILFAILYLSFYVVQSYEDLISIIIVQIIIFLNHWKDNKSAIIITIITIPLIYFFFIPFLYPLLKFLFNIFKFLVHVEYVISIIINIFLYYFCNFETINNIIFSIKEATSRYITEKFYFIKDKILIKIDPSVKIPRKLIISCLSEDKSYNFQKFIDIINTLERKDFKKFTEGELNLDNDFDEIEDLCKKYEIADRENFKLLISKFHNFQIIFSEWSMDITKHEYFKRLWLFYPTIYKLNDLSDEELEEYLKEINYSSWEQEVKDSFRQCISNSPEIKAMEFSNINFEGFMEFINDAMNCKETFKKHENMKQYENTLYNTIKQLTKKVIEAKGNIVSSSSKVKDIIENRAVDYFLKNYIKIDKVTGSSNHYLKKMLNFMKDEKFKNILNLNESLISPLNVAFSFLGLTYHVISLMKCFKKLIFDCKDEVFIIELNKIISNFQSHKEKIKYISQDDDKDLKLIETITKEIIKDRNDIINLIQKIEKEKDYEVLKKKQHIGKTIRNGIGAFVGISVGTAISGGIVPIIGSISGAISIIKTIKEGVKAINNIKNINALKKLLKKARAKQNEIERVINELKNIYIKRESSQFPEEMRRKIYEKYCDLKKSLNNDEN